MATREICRKAAAIVVILVLLSDVIVVCAFSVEEATISDLQAAFKLGSHSSTQLVLFYLRRLRTLNPLLHAVIEVNPHALRQARRADLQRSRSTRPLPSLHGIPILLKDNIATHDKLNTTAGSFALLGSKVPRDAGVVARLRKAGAVILGKANLSEWANYRSSNSSNGWSARGGQTKNPYVLSADPGGSSSGSAVAAAANLVSVTLGSETDGSILFPSSRNAVVGIKPSVGLTSRAGVIPISRIQDTIGPICRTVTDAVEVLDVIAGYDKLDNATWSTASLIPKRGYKQFLKSNGMRGKRLGVLRQRFLESSPTKAQIIDAHLQTIRKLGGNVIDNVTIPTIDEIKSGISENTVLSFDFKQDLNSYLAELVESPVRSLEQVIQFNIKHASLEELQVYDQANFIAAEATTGYNSQAYKDAVKMDRRLTKRGIDKAMKKHKLDAVIAASLSDITRIAAIAGYPGISVPAGYIQGVPFGIFFVGRMGSEPTLIEIAFAFEHATRIRKPPSFLQSPS